MKKILILFVVLLSIPTILPLFHQGFFPMHDDTQVARVLTMGKALRDGMLPVRWVDYLGYNLGYPIFNFYAPFAYYIGGFFTLIGFAALPATKIMLGIAMLLAGVSMYLLGNSLFGKKAGILSAIFYVYSPYHALNLYVRGAVGELWAYGFLPLPFWGLWAIYKTGKFRYVVITSLGISGIVLSHNLTAFMTLPFILLAILILSIASWKKKAFISIYFLIGSLLFGGLLSSFYAIPALLEMQYTNVASILGGGSNPVDHFICVSQFWQSMWGFGGSAPGCIDGMSFSLGKLHILFLLAGFISMAYLLKRRLYQHIWVMLFIFASFAITFFMMYEASKSIWQSIEFFNYLQFPWRFLSIASLTASLIAGGTLVAVNRFKPFAALVVLIVMGAVAIMYYGKLFTPQYFKTDVASYTNLGRISWDISKISDEYLPTSIQKPKNPQQVASQLIEPLTGQVRVNSLQEKTQVKKLEVNTQDARVKLNLATFPAWQIVVDGREIKPTMDKGTYQFSLSDGSHTITVRFVETHVELLANLLTIVGLSLLIAGIIKSARSKSL